MHLFAHNIKFMAVVLATTAIMLFMAGCGRRAVSNDSCSEADSLSARFSAGAMFTLDECGNKAYAACGKRADFADLANDSRPAMIWHWISGYISPEGAAADIETFARAGIGRVIITIVDMPDLEGPVRAETMSNEWFTTLRAALKAAEQADMEIGLTDWPSAGAAYPVLCAEGVWRDNLLKQTPNRAISGAQLAEIRFDAYIGEILRQIPADKRRALRFIVGGEEIFNADNLPSTVCDILTDSRREADYVARLHELCAENGLQLISRSVTAALRSATQTNSDRDAAGDCLLGVSKIIPEGKADNIRTAVTAARACGKRIFAEAGNIERQTYANTPLALKRAADRAYAEGADGIILTGAVQQATTVDFPGINTWLFSEADRQNPWVAHLDLLTDYIYRCNLILHDTERVADIAVITSTEAQSSRITDIITEAGYDVDYVTPQMLLAAEVRDGRICTTDGRIYTAAVYSTVQPQGQPSAADDSNGLMTKAIRTLTERGAFVAGIGESFYDWQPVVEKLHATLAPDVDVTTPSGQHFAGENTIRFSHRCKGNAADIYMLTNIGTQTFDNTITLRSVAWHPELWNPADGSRYAVRTFSAAQNCTSFRLTLAPSQTLFVVMREGGTTTQNTPQQSASAPCEYRWDVSFTSPLAEDFTVRMYDLHDLATDPDPAIRYFGGTVTYRSVFESQKPDDCDRIILDIGDMGVSAKVWVNNQYAGGAWCAPYQTDITRFVQRGRNTLRIDVATTWRNTVIGSIVARDNGLPYADLHFKVNTCTAQTPLTPSGLARTPVVKYYSTK